MAKQEIENTNFLIDINEKSFDNKAFSRKHLSFLVKKLK
jgi:hypothetical protein